MPAIVESRLDQPIRLSVCVATYGRAAFIGQTLQLILAQADERVEIVVVDGASPDATSAVVSALQANHPRLVYQREATNAGVDCDFDKAVGYARGEYCWLMSDDDVLTVDAIATVLAALEDDPALLVVNAEFCNKDLSVVLKRTQLGLAEDQEFGLDDHERLFAATASYLSFIGAVVIRRATWLARERTPYFGSLFIHMGVIFQTPTPGRAKVITRPLIRIRYGNALWTSRGFEIWTEKWPDLVWSFHHFSAISRERISPRYPARRLVTLLWYRGIGAYGPAEYRRVRAAGAYRPCHPLAGLVARVPASLVNTSLAIACFASRHGDASMKLYDLSRAGCATGLTRWLARRSQFPETER